MNRRNFLTSMAYVPVIGALGKVIDFTPKTPTPSIPTQCRDRFTILTPADICRHWIYVDKPTFYENGKTYYIKTIKFRDFVIVSGPDLKYLDEYQRCARREIKQIGLTHIHSVRFSSSPILDQRWRGCYYAFVRGAIVK